MIDHRRSTCVKSPRQRSALDEPHLLLAVMVAAAGVILPTRSSWSGVSSTTSAAMFSSTPDTRLVPGVGTMSSPWASSQASETCPGVHPASQPMNAPSSALLSNSPVDCTVNTEVIGSPGPMG
jgi:hypothetical protein